MAYLRNYGEAWAQLNTNDAFVFIDNHDTQHYGTGHFNTILTFWDANAFQLAWQYGHVRFMSSYNWPQQIHGNNDENTWVGPPSNGGVAKDALCFNGEWIYEHRWREISNMVKSHNASLGYPVSNWWDNGADRIAFGRR